MDPNTCNNSNNTRDSNASLDDEESNNNADTNGADEEIVVEPETIEDTTLTPSFTRGLRRTPEEQEEKRRSRNSSNMIADPRPKEKRGSRETTTTSGLMRSTHPGAMGDVVTPTANHMDNQVTPNWTGDDTNPRLVPLRGLAKNQQSTPNSDPLRNNGTSPLVPLRGLAKNYPQQRPGTRQNGQRSSTEVDGDTPIVENPVSAQTIDAEENESETNDELLPSREEAPHNSTSDSTPSVQASVNQAQPGPSPALIRGNTGLAVARMVQDHDTASLMEAQQVDPEELQHLETEKKKRKKCRMIGYLILAICCTVLAISLGLGLKGKDEDKGPLSMVGPTTTPSAAPSDAPTMAPTGSLDLLLEDLQNYTLETLKNISTPQWKGLDWLSRHPKITFMEEWQKKQLFALATFYYAMEGPHWPQDIRDDWMLYDKSECLWFSSEFGDFSSDGQYVEILSYNKTPCNEQDEYEFLLLSLLKLSDHNPSIPAEISLLTSLSILALPRNDINATVSHFLPSQIHHMSNLTELNLGYNLLAGRIPTEVGELTNMVGLGLSNNELTGAIPSQVGLMTHATELYLYSNMLSSSVPTEVGLLTNIVALWLYQNELTGAIPTQIGLMTHMTKLYLHSNILSSSIPTEVGLLTDMVGLALHSNELTGAIPSQIGLMTHTREQILFSNKLSSSVPTEVGMLTNMVLLTLAINELTGAIPSQIGLMTHLELLLLNSNMLNSSVPTEVGLLTNMVVGLSLHSNELTGAIPSQIGLMTHTAELDLYSNMLSSSVPTEIGLMTHMTKLSLSSNMLSSSVPTEVGSLTDMVDLSLNQNALTGAIPSQIGLMTQLTGLYLYSNLLSSSVPTEVGTLLDQLAWNGSLSILRLENNTFIGTISETLCVLGELELDAGLGLSFDCNDQLCGCCWCPCPGSNYSGECDTGGKQFVPSRDDEDWPGSFPNPVNRSNAIAINIHTDAYPEETSFEWSQHSDSKVWDTFNTWRPQDANALHSYTMELESEALYRLRLFDSYEDGTCCQYGFGWFTVTNSTPSLANAHGSVVWEARGDALIGSLDVILWIDGNGHAQQVEYIPE